MNRIRTAAYDPMADGLMERFHRSPKAAFMTRGNPTRWRTTLAIVSNQDCNN